MDSEGDRNAKIDYLVQLFEVAKWLSGNSRWVAHRVPQAMLLLSNDPTFHYDTCWPNDGCQRLFRILPEGKHVGNRDSPVQPQQAPLHVPGRQPCPTYPLGTQGAWQSSGPSLWSGLCPCSSHQGASGASLLTVPLCQRPRSPKQGAGLSKTELESFKTKTLKDNRF